MDTLQLMVGHTFEIANHKAAFRGLEWLCDNYTAQLVGMSIELTRSNDPYDDLWTERIENSVVPRTE